MPAVDPSSLRQKFSLSTESRRRAESGEAHKIKRGLCLFSSASRRRELSHELPHL